MLLFYNVIFKIYVELEVTFKSYPIQYNFSFQDKMRSPHIILKEITQNLFKKNERF